MQDARADTAVAVLLTVAAVAIAVIGARAALLGDSGGDTFHTAIREDVRSGARIVGDVRRLYEEDATVAHKVAAAQLLGEEVDRAAAAARGEVAQILDAEAAAQLQFADVLSASSALARDDPKGALQLDGGDILRRLAALRAERDRELAALDPDATEARGADESRESSLLVAATIPVAIAFLLGAIAEGFPARRRLLVPAGYAFVAVAVAVAIVVEVSL